MTASEYRTLIQQWGLTAIPNGRYGNEALHQDREGQVWRITDPETLSEDERDAMIAVYRRRLGIQNH